MPDSPISTYILPRKSENQITGVKEPFSLCVCVFFYGADFFGRPTLHL